MSEWLLVWGMASLVQQQLPQQHSSNGRPYLNMKVGVSTIDLIVTAMTLHLDPID